MIDTERQTCIRRILVRGEDRLCGQSVGLTTWTDHVGGKHAACRDHVEGMKRRWPESVPEREPNTGRLDVSTPWARGAFGPADRIEVQNLIPKGYTVGVSAHRPGSYIVWLNAEGRGRLITLDHQRDAVVAARELAITALGLDVAASAVLADAEGQPERYTFATEPWILDAEGGASLPVSYMREARAAR